MSDRLLVTAAHVVEGVDTVRLEGTQDPPVLLSARVLYRDRVEDVAILSVDDPLRQPPLGLQPGALSVGTEVFAAGSPIDGVVLSKGRIIDTGGPEGIISSTPVDPGNSGGPLLDANGAVVGMVYAQSIPAGNAYSVPVEVLNTAIAVAESQPEPESSADDQDRGDSATAELRLGIAALFVSLIALGLSIVAFVLAVIGRGRKRMSGPPITITLNEE